MDIYKSSYTGALLCLDAGGEGDTTGTLNPRGIGKPLIKLGKKAWSNLGGGTGDYYGIGFGYSPLLTDFNCVEIGTLITSTSGQETGDLVFSTRPTVSNVAATERMRITSTGNVVIGGNVNVGSLTNPSDSRIKKDIEDINDATALNKLLLIQPTTYNYIDVERNKGFGKVYGFIAQQIREVIPEAVPIIEAIIPNIYKNCLINNKREVYHNIPLDTPIDTEVKIKGSEYKIKEVYEDYFVIDKDIEDVEAFVYGYNINDFHSLNKDYIFTLNVCATQELHRRIEAQSVVIKSQEDRIKDLETKVAILMSNTT